MKKYKLAIEETIRYQHDVVIEVDEDMSEDELNTILDEVQGGTGNYGVNDIDYEFKRRDIEVLKINYDDSGYITDFEITDYWEE